MPSFDIGDTEAMVAAAERTVASLKPWVDQGYDVVVPTPSCSLMIKREYAGILAGDDAQRVANQTYDICEYLMKLKREGDCRRTSPGIQVGLPTKCPVTYETRTSASNPKN